MTNREQYIAELKEQDKDYRTTIKDFIRDIQTMGLTDRFKDDIKSIGIHNDVYDIAVDYSIPVMMVKLFMKAEA